MAMIDDLKQERIRRGLSQAAVAHAMGTTQSAMSRAEHGGNPTQDFLQRYQEALDTYPSSSTLGVETIRLLVQAIARRNGIAELYAYGSVAQGCSRPDSDIDLLYRRNTDAEYGLFETARLRDELESALGRTVSLLSFDALERKAAHSRASKRFLEHIRPDLVRVA